MACNLGELGREHIPRVDTVLKAHLAPLGGAADIVVAAIEDEIPKRQSTSVS